MCASENFQEFLLFKTFMTEAAIIQKPVHLLRKSMDWFLYDNGLRHERVKTKYY